MFCNIDTKDFIKILVFDEENLTKTLIEDYLKDLSFPYILEKYNEFSPSYIKEVHDSKIIIVNINNNNAEALLNDISLYSDKKNVFIVISNDNSTDLSVRVFRAGAQEFLQKPIVKSDFIYALQMIYKINFSMPDNDNSSKIYTAVSFNKNEGKTNILINAAKETADLSNEKVLLIDFNNSLNDISFFLDINNKFNPNYYFNNLTEKNSEKLLEDVSRYKDSNLFIMSSGYYINDKGKINIEKINEVFNILKKHFKYIFIDMNFEDKLLNEKIINTADVILYVILPNINITDKFKQDFEKIFRRKKIYLICNKYEEKFKNNIEELKESLETQINLKIAQNYMAFGSSKNSHKTLKEIYSELDIVQSFTELAQYIINRD